MSSHGGALVAVVGSANLDVVVAVDRFPAPGETVLGGDVQEIPGGKGLNQAVAAACIGPSALVACVGEDDAGQLLLSHLEQRGVVTSHVRRVETPTGRAFIQVAPDGENSIVVAAGANARLQPQDVQRALDDLDAAVVLCQLEVPLEPVHRDLGAVQHLDRDIDGQRRVVDADLHGGRDCLVVQHAGP